MEKSIRTKRKRGGSDGLPLHNKAVIVRLTKHEHKILGKAADVSGRSVSSILARAGLDKAHEILGRRYMELA